MAGVRPTADTLEPLTGGNVSPYSGGAGSRQLTSVPGECEGSDSSLEISRSHSRLWLRGATALIAIVACSAVVVVCWEASEESNGKVGGKATRDEAGPRMLHEPQATCEGCPAIKIWSARYGGDCDDNWKIHHGIDDTETLGKACDGFSNCTYVLDQLQEFASWCTRKDYVVKYDCGDGYQRGASIPSEARGKTLYLNCEDPEPGELVEFYTYRAIPQGTFEDYSFGNVNTANMEGIMWYLMNEVVTNYKISTACPRKFNISEIHRIKIRMRATKELTALGMSTGVRFSYDFGQCMGRCFPGNTCSNSTDCELHYEKYGYFVGCNKFTDNYPFPDYDTSAPEGAWFSFPLEGRCDYPTGEHNCTWSYEWAGVLTLLELEQQAPSISDGNCCNGHCTDLWEKQEDKEKMDWRIDQAWKAWGKKYPNATDEGWPNCNFQWKHWYEPDLWEHVDPWAPSTSTTTPAEPEEAKPSPP